MEAYSSNSNACDSDDCKRVRFVSASPDRETDRRIKSLENKVHEQAAEISRLRSRGDHVQAMWDRPRDLSPPAVGGLAGSSGGRQTVAGQSSWNNTGSYDVINRAGQSGMTLTPDPAAGCYAGFAPTVQADMYPSASFVPHAPK